MKLYKFEMIKLWRQKKFIWLLLIVLLYTSGIFLLNASEQSMIAERAGEKLETYIMETDILAKQHLELVQEDGDLPFDLELKRLEYLKKMQATFFHWKLAIYEQNWNDIPIYEGEFLTHLEQFENYEGSFRVLHGVELKNAIQKNTRLLVHNLPYEDEEYPMSPHLILKESTTLLFSVLGILLLLLFFGNTLAVEKEQNTWLTLKTQPFPKWKLILSKYMSLVTTIIIYLAMVIAIGLIIPMIFTDHKISMQYPQIMLSIDNFTVISILHYLTRAAILFICASTFVFSLVLFIGGWVKSTFSAMMLTCFKILFGFIITGMYSPLQTALNPFHYFNFTQILSEMPQGMDWLYPFAALLWSCLFVCLAVFLPEKESNLSSSTDLKKPFYSGSIQKRPQTLWNISIFEWRKIQRRGLLKQLIIFLILLIIIGYFILSKQALERETTYVEYLQTIGEESEGLITYTYQQISFLEEMEKLMEETDEEAGMFSHNIVEYEEMRAFFIERLAKNKAGIIAYEQKNWVPYYEYQLYETRSSNDEFDSGNWEYNYVELLGKYTLDVSIEEKKWLIEHKVQPIFSGEYVLTKYTHWGNRIKEQSKWEEENRKVDSSGLYSLFIYFDNYLIYIPMILLLFLLGGGFAAERGKRSTLNYLKTQPITEKKILLGKMISSVITVLLSSLGIFLFIVLISTVFNRFGDWNYPILYYDSPMASSSPTYTGNLVFGYLEGFHFIPLGNYLVNSIVLFLFISLFFIVLANVLSLFFRNQLGVFVTTILIGGAGYFMSIRRLSDMAHLSPFTFLNIGKITNGEVSTLMNNPNINVLTGSISLLASSLFLIVAGYVFLSWKNRIRG